MSFPLVASLLLAACGVSGPDLPAPDAGSPPAGPPATTAPPFTRPGPGDSPLPGDLPVPAPPGSGKSAARVTVTGTVESGVEANCLMLRGYQLIGGPRVMLRQGATVTVTGQVQPDLVTTCQQGTPLMVESVEPAPAHAGTGSAPS